MLNLRLLSCVVLVGVTAVVINAHTGKYQMSRCASLLHHTIDHVQLAQDTCSSPRVMDQSGTRPRGRGMKERTPSLSSGVVSAAVKLSVLTILPPATPA